MVILKMLLTAVCLNIFCKKRVENPKITGWIFCDSRRNITTQNARFPGKI